MTDNKNENTPVEDDAEFITLEFEDGKIECEIIGLFDVNDKEYIALQPDDGSDDVYIYGYKQINDEEFDLIYIVDDKEFEAAAEEYNRLMAEEDEQ